MEINILYFYFCNSIFFCASLIIEIESEKTNQNGQVEGIREDERSKEKGNDLFPISINFHELSLWWVASRARFTFPVSPVATQMMID